MGIQSIKDIPAQLVQVSHGDMLGCWLPYALADIYCLMLAYFTHGKHSVDRLDVLDGWGFDSSIKQAEERERVTELSLSKWYY